MYTRTLKFETDIDGEALPAHLANCLWDLRPREVEVNGNRVSFTGGFFLSVDKWNLLIPFGFGDITVHADTHQLRYRLSIRQLLVGVTALLGILSGVVRYAFGLRDFLPAITIGWIWMVGLNLFIGFGGVDKFLRSSIETAPRTKW